MLLLLVTISLPRLFLLTYCSPTAADTAATLMMMMMMIVGVDTVAPVFTELPRDLEVTASGRISLQCVARGVPVPTITWKINNTDFHSTNTHSVSRSVAAQSFCLQTNTCHCQTKAEFHGRKLLLQFVLSLQHRLSL